MCWRCWRVALCAREPVEWDLELLEVVLEVLEVVKDILCCALGGDCGERTSGAARGHGLCGGNMRRVGWWCLTLCDMCWKC